MKSNIPIFIINLAKDTDRKAYMQHLCEKYSIHCRFIEAVMGKELSSQYIQSVYDKDKAIEKIGRELGLGEIGCALSHIHIYKKIIEENLPYGVILEDDIDTLENLQTIIDNHQNLPADLELLLLGEYRDHLSLDTQFSSFWRCHSIGHGFKAVRLVKPSFGAHAYMISNRGAKRLLDHLHKIVEPIDHYTGNDKYMNVYAIRPTAIMPYLPYATQSNLEDDRSNKALAKNQNQFKEKLIVQVLKRIGLEKPLHKLYSRLKIPVKYTID